MLYLLDYDLRIDEMELLVHFSPFFRKTSLVSSGSTPPAARQQMMRGMSYSASCDNVFTLRLPPPKKSEVVPIILSSAPSAGGKPSETSTASKAMPVTPDQGTKRPIFTRAISQSIKRTITGSGGSSTGSTSDTYSELTEDHGSSDEYSSTSDEDDAMLTSAATAKRVQLSGPRYLMQRSVSTSTASSKATSFPLTPSSSADSETGPIRIGGMVKSVSCYDARSPLAGKLAGKGGKNTWA